MTGTEETKTAMEKIESPPLTPEEIADIKESRASNDHLVFKSADELMRWLNK